MSMFSKRRLLRGSHLSLGALLLTICSVASARAIQVALPVYVFPEDPFFQSLLDPAQTPIPPALVIVNIGNGDGDVALLDHDVERLRARFLPNGQHVKVIAYVHTGVGKRPEAEVRTSIQRYLKRQNGRNHYDGIFFDEVANTCGSAPGLNDYRDRYLRYRRYVQAQFRNKAALIVNNLGTAVPACFLQKGRETADVFITFEDSAAHYLTDASSVDWRYGWVGGNVIVNDRYVLGDEFGASRFWHLVYNVDNSEPAYAQQIVDKAFQRHASYVDATDAYLVGEQLNPWTTLPRYLNETIRHAETLNQ